MSKESVVRLGALAVLLTSLSGCVGWARGQVGGAQDLDGRQGYSGAYAAVDGAIGIKLLQQKKDLPTKFAVHTSGDVIMAPDRKSIGWGTGLTAYGLPRPIAPYVIGGTTLHADKIGDRYSFGSFSPYGEIGIRASVPSRYEDGGDGWFVSLGIGAAMHLNYLVGGSDTIDGFSLLKLGIGWEKN